MVGYADISKRIAELRRLIENLLRMGTICEADYDAARVRVKSGDIVTDWLPWFTDRAGVDINWWPPTVGEQIMILSPGGDLAQGVVLPSIYQKKNPACAQKEEVYRAVMGDGAKFEYDRKAKHLSIDVPGDIDIKAGGEIRINGKKIFLN